MENTDRLTVSPALADWLARMANGKRVKDYFVLPGNSAPAWDYSPGVTHWRNGRPKSYDRSTSTVTVGEQWLAEMFPVQYVAMRLRGIRHLELTTSEIKEAVQIRMQLQQAAEQAARQASINAEAWSRLEAGREHGRTTDPECERLYA